MNRRSKVKFVVGVTALFAALPVAAQILWALAMLGTPPLVMVLLVLAVYAVLLSCAIALDTWWAGGKAGR